MAYEQWQGTNSPEIIGYLLWYKSKYVSVMVDMLDHCVCYFGYPFCQWGLI